MEADKTLPLKDVATRLVFGDGNPEAEILFIGEGPGYWEDQKGLPFVGNAGALLNQLLINIGMKRGDVYITNVIHFRAPDNRDPVPEEIESFKPYLNEIIKIIDPKLIITLGRFSMGKFLGSVTITGIHGREKLVEWEGRRVWVLPMYHPAAALRNGEIKRRLMADFDRIPEVLEKARKEVGIVEKAVEEKKENAEQMALV